MRECEHMQELSPDKNASEITSDAGHQETGFANLKPKLPLRETPMTIGDDSPKTQSPLANPHVARVSQIGQKSKQFHVKVDS